MAAKATIVDGRILTETALANLTIIRSIPFGNGMPGMPAVTGVDPVFGVNLAYADSEFLVDSTGKRERVLTQGLNQHWMGYTPEQVAAMRATPLHTADGTATTWGEVTDGLLDAAIRADMAAQAALAAPAV